jgi:GGDEF domain-containing protein
MPRPTRLLVLLLSLLWVAPAAAEVRTGVPSGNELRAKDVDALLERSGVTLSAETRRLLHQAAQLDWRDPATGLADAKDRIPVLMRSLLHLSTNPAERAFYIEVDVRNLGGLNAALGHSEANVIMREFAHQIRDELLGIRTQAEHWLANGEASRLENPIDVLGFRHGGDEFSFIVVGPAERLTPEMIDRSMARVQERIASYVAAPRDAVTPDGARHFPRGLSEIPGTKRGSVPGTGVYYGVSEFSSRDMVRSPGGEMDVVATTKAIVGRADRVVEAAKQQLKAPETPRSTELFRGQGQRLSNAVRSERDRRVSRLMLSRIPRPPSSGKRH